MTDPQFYTALTSKEVCNNLGWYQKFHGPQAKLSFPSRDEFVSTVLSYPESNRTVHNVEILVTCQVCTASQKASLHSLQGNHGISCICSKMSFNNPQYYDLIHDKRVCQTLSIFSALHQEKKRIVLPSRTMFYDAIAMQTDKVSAFVLIPDVKCSHCGCVSDGFNMKHPLLCNLRQNQGIACFCSGKMSPTCSMYYDCMCNTELCDKLGSFAGFHRSAAVMSFPDRNLFVDAVRENGAHAKIPGLQCTVCKVKSDATTLNQLQQNGSISCFCNGHLKLNDPQYYDCLCNADLCNRLGVFAAFHSHSSRIAIPSREEFNEVINSVASGRSPCGAKLKLLCQKCGKYIQSTSIGHLSSNTGCPCNKDDSRHYRHHFNKFKDNILLSNLRLHISEEEWLTECSGNTYCPPVSCRLHPQYGIMRTTDIAHMKTYKRQCCPACGHAQTEGILLIWFMKTEVIIKPQYKGPGRTRFDFHLQFPDDFEILIELDGAQHFWSDHYYYTDAGCERDLLKEEWAIAKRLSVVRVLQEDVWNDLYGWQGWLANSIEAARSGEPRVFTPDTPEYRSANSAYVQLRSPG